MTTANARESEFRHAGFRPRIGEMHVEDIRPSPENDQLYRPVDPKDPEIIALAESMRVEGVLDPLVVTEDDYLVSGHRRRAAAILAGIKKVPIRILKVWREDDPEGFVKLLREYNRQRVKSLDEVIREEVVSADPEEAYEALAEYRRNQSATPTTCLKIEGETQRSQISRAKEPFMRAILEVLKARRKFWPLSDRAVHYALLNDPPLKHASKPDSIYCNDRKSYDALTELLTRMRLDGWIPREAIDDPTRPVTTWNVHRAPNTFIRKEIDGFLKGFYRDLMQSQPNQVELIVEKNTIEPIVKPVAADFCIPLISGRGYCSLPPRQDMAERYRKSGKEKLILLMLTDLDPDGEEIAHSLARSLRDDFGIQKVHPVKVALTKKQVTEYRLPPQMLAKKTSAHHAKFTARHGKHAYELEALDPEILQGIVRDAILDVIDVDAFNREAAAEKEDAAYLAQVRGTVHAVLKRIELESP